MGAVGKPQACMLNGTEDARFVAFVRHVTRPSRLSYRCLRRQEVFKSTMALNAKVVVFVTAVAFVLFGNTVTVEGSVGDGGGPSNPGASGTGGGGGDDGGDGGDGGEWGGGGRGNRHGGGGRGEL